MFIDVLAVANDAVNEEKKGRIFVAIDVFRATSTIITALGNGCSSVYPVYDVKEARDTADSLGDLGVLLGGEAHMHKIPGFDLGNSPLEYSSEKVLGRPVVITTTNGTKAIRNSCGADDVIIAAFLNNKAVSRYIAKKDKDVVIVCAGTEGRFTMEDALCAGMIISNIESAGINVEMSDFAMAVRELYLAHRSSIKEVLSGTAHFRRLVENGFSRDVDYCLLVDTVSIVPYTKEDRIMQRDIIKLVCEIG
ncbi:MAG: 2-phosphosulfolactate phosphatase [Bacillota bacterium]